MPSNRLIVPSLYLGNEENHSTRNSQGHDAVTSKKKKNRLPLQLHVRIDEKVRFQSLSSATFRFVLESTEGNWGVSRYSSICGLAISYRFKNTLSTALLKMCVLRQIEMSVGGNAGCWPAKISKKNFFLGDQHTRDATWQKPWNCIPCIVSL